MNSITSADSSPPGAGAASSPFMRAGLGAGIAAAGSALGALAAARGFGERGAPGCFFDARAVPSARGLRAEGLEGGLDVMDGDARRAWFGEASPHRPPPAPCL